MSEDASWWPPVLAWIKGVWPRIRSLAGRFARCNELESKARVVAALIQPVADSTADIEVDFNGLQIEGRTEAGQRRVIMRDRERGHLSIGDATT